jgi:SAM-dependent methyltransferase
MTNSLSFDGLVALYDETRYIDPVSFQKAIQFLIEHFPVLSFPSLFEPGIGTGRIAIPFAQKGYDVTGVDISPEMLKALRHTQACTRLGKPVRFSQADITSLPFDANTFDLALVVHLFYFIQDWKKAADEIMRVTRAGGAVVLMHTGMGMEIPELNKGYKELCLERGVCIEQVGVKSTKEVVDYYRSTGCKAECIKGRWRWISRIRIGKALDYIRAKAYSFTIAIPEEVHQHVIERMEHDLRDQLRSDAEVPNEIYIILIHKDSQNTRE